nr:type I CRISPR-associated protein Cas7 [Planctomycetota bacterium]
AEQTGFGDEDLELFKKALAQMFEYDRSAARGQMVPRACVAFRHESQLGNARADQLFERVTCALKSEVADEDRPSRQFSDCDLKVDESDLPDGISVEQWV